mmetsp:Transcript_22692/g.53588  ORF Transcript_22692/g.53588 Transcript_22692/m.53588 type:complete len:113 (-) Transcript_22692:305-643(-)
MKNKLRIAQATSKGAIQSLQFKIDQDRKKLSIRSNEAKPPANSIHTFASGADFTSYQAISLTSCSGKWIRKKCRTLRLRSISTTTMLLLSTSQLFIRLRSSYIRLSARKFTF